MTIDKMFNKLSASYELYGPDYHYPMVFDILNAIFEDGAAKLVDYHDMEVDEFPPMKDLKDVAFIFNAPLRFTYQNNTIYTVEPNIAVNCLHLYDTLLELVKEKDDENN